MIYTLSDEYKINVNITTQYKYGSLIKSRCDIHFEKIHLLTMSIVTRTTTTIWTTTKCNKIAQKWWTEHTVYTKYLWLIVCLSDIAHLITLRWMIWWQQSRTIIPQNWNNFLPQFVDQLDNHKWKQHIYTHIHKIRELFPNKYDKNGLLCREWNCSRTSHTHSNWI